MTSVISGERGKKQPTKQRESLELVGLTIDDRHVDLSVKSQRCGRWASDEGWLNNQES